MFKISAFSKLSRISVKTLRYYDELDLLKPATVDKYTGYRYYSAKQLLTVQRIVIFKNDGFTLKQIKSLLDQEISTKLIKHTLIDKQKELQRIIQESKQQLNEIETRLARTNDMDNQTMISKKTIRNIQAQTVASIRDIVPQSHLCLLLDELKQHIRLHNAEEDQDVTIIWHNCDMEEDLIDVEVSVPFLNDILENERIKTSTLPEFLAASFLHSCDPYSDSCEARTELATWITEKNYRLSEKEPIREIYLTSDKNMYGKMRMAELLIPIQRI